jgi:GntR family transcriptional regulator, transcriptional repressor for pyruvate dehydrogenase complex
MSGRSGGTPSRGAAEQVVGYVRGLIERGELKAGDRLPPERDLASHLGVSRPTVRAGLRALATLGVVQARRGAGTFITDGPPILGSEPLSFMAALHGFTRDEMYEVRRILEVGAAGLAAERARGEHLAALADEVTSLYASIGDAHAFLLHDINFHRAIGAASCNPIVASLMEMVAALYYEQRRDTASRALDRDFREAAEMHRRIYQAVRDRDAARARAEMNAHLLTAQAYQVEEEKAHQPSATTASRAKSES